MLVAWISRQHGLGRYFNLLSHSDYILDEGRFVVAAVLPEAAEPDSLADGLWAWAGPDIDVIPKVKLYTKGINVPVTATEGSLSDSPFLYDSSWDALAAVEGENDAEALLSLTVSLGIAPLGKGRSPTATFIIEPRLIISVWGEEVDAYAQGDTNWLTFSHGEPSDRRWSALRVKSDAADVVDYARKNGRVLTRSVSRESCLKMLGRHERYGRNYEWHLHGFSDFLPDDDGCAPSAAPTKTFMSAIQLNLAQAPEPEKLSTLLEQRAAELVKALSDAQKRNRRLFDEAIAPLMAHWQSDTQNEQNEQ